jgi:hypothetical protein
MPLHPSFLATFYQPAWMEPEFFEVAETASIYQTETPPRSSGTTAIRKRRSPFDFASVD